MIQKKEVEQLKRRENASLEPTISIVVPTYNQGKFILACLKSIQAQTLESFEVIIQDANSTDQTEEICTRFCQEDSRFQYFRQSDRGQSDAINKGLEKSKGKYWNWICSDDLYLDEHALMHLYERITKNKDPNCIGMYGQAIYLLEDGSPFDKYSYRLGKRPLTQDDFKMRWPICQPACLFKKHMVCEVSGVDASLDLGMDLDLILKMLSQEGRYLDHVKAMIAGVRIHNNSKSTKGMRETALNSLRLIKSYFGSVGSPWFSQYSHQLSDFYFIKNAPRINKKVANIIKWFLLGYPYVPLRNRFLHRYWDAIEENKSVKVYEAILTVFRYRICYVVDTIIYVLLAYPFIYFPLNLSVKFYYRHKVFHALKHSLDDENFQEDLILEAV